jgi:hypothetical protein
MNLQHYMGLTLIQPGRMNTMAINWRQNQPIIHQLRVVLDEHFPFFLILGYAHHRSGIGGYVNRQRRQGGTSHHSQGRAADIFLFDHKKYEKLLGDNLAPLFWDNRTDLGVDHVIWSGTMWSTARNGPRPIIPADGIRDHNDHIHVSFTRAGSQLQPSQLNGLVKNLRHTLDDAIYKEYQASSFPGVQGRVEGMEEQPLWDSPYDAPGVVRAKPRYI